MSTTEQLRRFAFRAFLRRMALLVAGCYALSVLIGAMALLGPQGDIEDTLPAHSVLYSVAVALGPFTGYVGNVFGVDALRFPLWTGLVLLAGAVVLLALAYISVKWRPAAWVFGALGLGWCIVWFGSGLVVLLSVAEL